MTGEGDVSFPRCCEYCPHLNPVEATCTHELRQSLVHELDTDTPCPAYTEMKTNAMNQLIETL